MSEIAPAGELVEETGFFALHLAAPRWVQVVVTAEVEKAVDEVADEFALPACAEPAGLVDSLINANENFAVQGGASVSPGLGAGGRRVLEE